MYLRILLYHYTPFTLPYQIGSHISYFAKCSFYGSYNSWKGNGSRAGLEIGGERPIWCNGRPRVVDYSGLVKVVMETMEPLTRRLFVNPEQIHAHEQTHYYMLSDNYI